MEEALQYVAELAKQELRSQGHYLTGGTERSIETIISGVDPIIGQMLIDEHAIYLDKGVTADRVPYSRGSGAGRSQYIDRLIEYVKKRKGGISDKDAKSFAFAIANKAKQTGHPTPGSYAFSANSRRKGWIQSTTEGHEHEIEQKLQLQQFIFGVIENKVDDIKKFLL